MLLKPLSITIVVEQCPFVWPYPKDLAQVSAIAAVSITGKLMDVKLLRRKEAQGLAELPYVN